MNAVSAIAAVTTASTQSNDISSLPWLKQVELLAGELEVPLMDSYLCNPTQKIKYSSMFNNHDLLTLKEFITAPIDRNGVGLEWSSWCNKAKAATLSKRYSISDKYTAHQILNLAEEVAQHLGREAIDTSEFYQVHIDHLQRSCNSINAKYSRLLNDTESTELELKDKIRSLETSNLIQSSKLAEQLEIIQSLETKLEINGTPVSEIQSKLVNQVSEVAELEANLSRLEIKLDNAIEDKSRAEARFAKLRSLHANTKERLRSYPRPIDNNGDIEELISLREALEQSQSELAQKTETYKTLELAVKDKTVALQNIIQRLSAELSKQKSSNKLLKSAFGKLQKTLLATQKELAKNEQVHAAKHRKLIITGGVLASVLTIQLILLSISYI